MDAIMYLRQEHSRVRKAFAAIAKASTEKTKKTKFEALCENLIRHETMEEKAWYPVLRQHQELREIIRHLVSEEKSAAATIKKFKKVPFGPIWKLRFTKFHHDVDHHAKEEEQELFPRVRELLTKAELNALGTKMRRYKASLE